VARRIGLGEKYQFMAQAAERPVVLIVEDEFLIRMHAALMIRDAGFDAVEAADADEAISILESRAFELCSPIFKCPGAWTA